MLTHEIPLGWALDKEGEMTTDPIANLVGVLLPMAQHTGYGITLAVMGKHHACNLITKRSWY